MSYLPSGIPGPEPTIDDRPFWEFCDRQELRIQRCARCGRHRMPPRPACPHCQAFEHEWVQASDDAELFSFSVVHQPAHPAISEAVPYNIAIVAFPSCDHARLISNVVDVPNEELRIGMKLKVTWEKAGNGRTIPRFCRA